MRLSLSCLTLASIVVLGPTWLHAQPNFVTPPPPQPAVVQPAPGASAAAPAAVAAPAPTPPAEPAPGAPAAAAPAPAPLGPAPTPPAMKAQLDRSEQLARIEYCTSHITKPLGDLGTNWSVGPAVSTQLLKYDLASKQASFNTSVGVGASFRYYPQTTYRGANNQTYTVPISGIRPACRATTTDAVSIDDDPKNGKIGEPLFSITPTVYASKFENSGDFAVQPAILLGAFRDLINVGAGFNLTGPDKGHVFLLFSLGYGFKF